MKHIKWMVGALTLAIIPVLAWAGLAHAQHFSTTTDEKQVIHSSLYSSGKDIDIKGTIEGDVYCMGQTVTIDANVQGDIICAGQNITVNGKVDGDVRLAGQSVSVNAAITRSATVAAMTFSLDAGATVGRDVTATGDTLNIKGKIGRDVVASGNATTLNGVVARNAKLTSQKVQLKSDAKVQGGLYYSSPVNADIAKGATVTGVTTHEAAKKGTNKNWAKNFNAFVFIFALAGLTLVAMTIVLFFPRFAVKTSGIITKSFGKALLVGVAASFLLPAICVGLLFTMIGIPLAVFVVMAALFAGMLSGPIVGLYVGRLIIKDEKNLVLAVFIGSLITITAYFIPVLGILVAVVAFWLGLGAQLLALREYTGKPARD
jgi:cytoskeletal protein CcmA (bactofilin family)